MIDEGLFQGMQLPPIKQHAFGTAEGADGEGDVLCTAMLGERGLRLLVAKRHHDTRLQQFGRMHCVGQRHGVQREQEQLGMELFTDGTELAKEGRRAKMI